MRSLEVDHPRGTRQQRRLWLWLAPALVALVVIAIAAIIVFVVLRGSSDASQPPSAKPWQSLSPTSHSHSHSKPPPSHSHSKPPPPPPPSHSHSKPPPPPPPPSHSHSKPPSSATCSTVVAKPACTPTPTVPVAPAATAQNASNAWPPVQHFPPTPAACPSRCFVKGDAVSKQPCFYGTEATAGLPVQWPTPMTCTAALAPRSGFNFPFLDADVTGAWKLYRYWIGDWTAAQWQEPTALSAQPLWPDDDSVWTDQLMWPIAIRSSAHPPNSPFASCLGNAQGCTRNPNSHGSNQNTGSNYQLTYMYEADNALYGWGDTGPKTWRVPPSLSGTGSSYTITLTDFVYGLVDGWAASPSTTAAPALAACGSGSSAPCAASVASRVACHKGSMDAAKAQAGLDGREPWGSYTCPSLDGKTDVVVTPSMQYPYCIDQCGNATKFNANTTVLPGTCLQTASNICGCACTASCAGCPVTLGRPGMMRGLDLHMGAAAAAAAAPSHPGWSDIADVVWGTPQAKRLYQGGKGGGYSLGPPTFEALTDGPADETFVTNEGGIVGPSQRGTPQGELHDAFYDGLKGENWGLLLQKGAVPLNTATLATDQGGNAVPLLNLVSDVVRTYRDPNLAAKAKPVVVMRALAADGAITQTANLTTARWWGSGYYEVTAKFPRMRGGVNAIWTFHGDSAGPYTNPMGCTSKTAAACEGFPPASATSTWGVPVGAALSAQTAPARNAMADPFGPDSAGNLTLVRNDEIDIELPTNAPELTCSNGVPDPSKPGQTLQSSAPMAWNTLNLNTYQYTGGGGDGAIPYVNMPIVSDEAVVDGEHYHVYGFQWHTGHMGADGDPHDPRTWEVQPHVNWYLDGAYVATINVFVPSRYSRLTIGFINTGNDNWHGDADDWKTPVACAYVSEVHIVPYHEDRDCWWPSPADQPVSLRNPTAVVTSKQTWLPLQYAFDKHWQGKNAGAPHIPWSAPYWGTFDFFGAQCDGKGAVSMLCSDAFKAWVGAEGLSGTVDTTIRGPTARVAATYAQVFPKSPCVSGLFYQCPNLPRPVDSLPPPCTAAAAADPSKSQVDSCGTATGSLISGLPPLAPYCHAPPPPLGTACGEDPSLVAACSGPDDVAPCIAELQAKCSGLTCDAAKGSCTAASGGTYSTYCKAANGQCSFKFYPDSGAGGGGKPSSPYATACSHDGPPVVGGGCTNTLSTDAPLTAGCKVNLPATALCCKADADCVTQLQSESVCGGADLTCDTATATCASADGGLTVEYYCNKKPGAVSGACHLSVSST